MMNDKWGSQLNWTLLPKVDLSSGAAEIELDGRHICLRLVEDRVYACSAKCPHAGASLVFGKVDAKGDIVCPLHGYKFSLQNGRNTSGEGYHLKTYPIEVRPDGLYIGLPENK